MQEVTERGYGRRDVVIEADDLRIVFEAKVGGTEPTETQLVKYADELTLWKSYQTRAVVALTQVELAKETAESVSTELASKGIGFHRIQWHEIVDLVLRHTPSGDSEIPRYLFDEFIRFVRSDYRMGYYDAEILIQDVNPLNAKIYREGWVYVTSPKNKNAPLYLRLILPEEQTVV